MAPVMEGRRHWLVERQSIGRISRTWHQVRDDDDDDDDDDDNEGSVEDNDDDEGGIEDSVNKEKDSETDQQVKTKKVKSTKTKPVTKTEETSTLVIQNPLPVISAELQTTSTDAIATVTVSPGVAVMDPATVTVSPVGVVIVSSAITNPIPAVTTSIFLTTTDKVVSLSSQPPRKGLDKQESSVNLDLPLPTSSSGDVVIPSTTSGTALENTAPSDNGDDKTWVDEKDDDAPQMNSSSAKHVLIGAGSIGIFILVCLVCWLGWRMIKKRRFDENGGGYGTNVGGLGETVLSKLSCLIPARASGTRQRRQVFKDKSAAKMQASFRNYGGSEKWQSGAAFDTSAMTTKGFSNPSKSLTSSPGFRHSKTDHRLTTKTQEPGRLVRELMAGRQVTDTYDPARRLANRTSELSSLSSGFGDGDIIVQAALMQTPPASVLSMQQSNNSGERFSWQDRKRRETVYTETSEDSPARFRTINSWVVQQRSRIKRDRQSADRSENQVPPLPSFPPESFARGFPVKSHQPPPVIDVG